MTRWTYGWLGGVVVLLALVLTAPANGACGSSESGNVPDECSTTSFFGLVHRTGDSEDVVTAYRIGMLVCLVVLLTCLVLDAWTRRARRRKLPVPSPSA